MAPSEAEAASFAYMRSQPSGASGTGARQSLSRAFISSAESAAEIFFFVMSIVIRSQSRSAASGPPSAASGEMCPT